MSLGVGFSSVVITIVIGTAIGIAAGYGGGWIDGALMRFVDIFISIPVFMLLLTIVAIYGSNVPLLITFIGISAFPGAARIVRAEVLSLKPREFITASRVIGSIALADHGRATSCPTSCRSSSSPPRCAWVRRS